MNREWKGMLTDSKMGTDPVGFPGGRHVEAPGVVGVRRLPDHFRRPSEPRPVTSVSRQAALEPRGPNPSNPHIEGMAVGIVGPR
jgi:hypothetical protein